MSAVGITMNCQECKVQFFLMTGHNCVRIDPIRGWETRVNIPPRRDGPMTQAEFEACRDRIPIPQQGAISNPTASLTPENMRESGARRIWAFCLEYYTADWMFSYFGRGRSWIPDAIPARVREKLAADMAVIGEAGIRLFEQRKGAISSAEQYQLAIQAAGYYLGNELNVSRKTTAKPVEEAAPEDCGRAISFED